MILKGFKEKSNKKHLNKLLSERKLNVTDNKVVSLGVIFNIDEVDNFEQFRELAKHINVRSNRVKIIAFSENEKEELNSWDACYSPMDFGWKGAVKNEELQEFLHTNFNVLISYYQQDILELKLMTALSKAEFKIGVFQQDQRLNDLIIQTDIKAFNLFKKEVFKYLTILKKIKE